MSPSQTTQAGPSSINRRLNQLIDQWQLEVRRIKQKQTALEKRKAELLGDIKQLEQRRQRLSEAAATLQREEAETEALLAKNPLSRQGNKP